MSFKSIGNTDPGKYKWIIVLCICLTSSSAMYSDAVIVPRSLEIMDIFHISVQQFSMLTTAGLLLPVFLGIILGVLADKFGVVNLVKAGYIVAVIAGLSRAFADSFVILLILTIFSACGGAIINAVSAKLLSRWFGVDLSRATGIIVAVAMLSQSLATATGALWRSLDSAYIGLTIIVILCGVFWYVFAEEKPDNVLDSKPADIKQNLSIVLRSKNVWLAGLGLAFFMGGNIINSRFFPTALANDYEIDVVEAGFSGSLFSVGLLCGNLIFPNIALLTGRQKPVLIFITLCGAVITYCNYSLGDTVFVYITTVIAGLFIGGIQPLYQSSPGIMPDIPVQAKGTAGGIISMLMMLGAIILPTYVIIPLSGGDYGQTFLLASFCFIIVTIISIIIPDCIAIQKKSNHIDHILDK